MLFPSCLYVWALAILAGTICAYNLKDDYTRNGYADFFDDFNFWTDGDPTNGTVDYVDQQSAWNNGLIGNGGNIYLGVDHANVASGRGRKSVRLTSKATYNPGTLIVADITHMPETCGTWPSFWTTSATAYWPQEGEIDIVEQVNNAKHNRISIHVSDKQGRCYVDPNIDQTAERDRFTECSEETNLGCNVNDRRENSFGSGFNNNNGGVYAMEWTAWAVKVWFFPRDSIPTGDHGPLGSWPEPSEWGTPTSVFRSSEGDGCDLNKHFKNQKIVINTTFCGWASAAWESSGCKASTGWEKCEEYVWWNWSAFGDAFWTFNSLKVFT
ncbi:hypothetical protein HBI56_233500 [Parastagonospora nodorum]|nr:hypothetical protein HBH53_075350 [Parastagonospora nodorum]KAH3998814.1 hypothetical protein HBI10_123430 [Parastagonospora nodorum]KAH4008135.1 hypothetical protein HBI13_241560 [Parastagonospora nodorum]KAH4333559.1 hypothetical protein HBH98_246610 [Parastagonospora nodorum]KAH4383705.1 hypothetical protein HBH99_183430 [Parastagonospora nodorum]